MCIAMSWETWLDETALFLTRLAFSVAIFAAFWLAGRVSRRLVIGLGERRHVDPFVTLLLASIVGTALLLFGAITALGTVGVNVAALVAGLGLTGFAVGFALKDIISNALSGMLLIMYKPFHHGDQIAVTGFEGTVMEINLRYTVLSTTDQKRVFLPNSHMFTNPVTVLPRGNSPATPT